MSLIPPRTVCRLTLASLLLALAACATAPPSPVLQPPSRAAAVVPATIRVQVSERGRLVVRTVPFDDYVAAAVLSEFDPPSGDAETIEKMYEVQAIVARTYALSERARHAREGFDVCSTTDCQLYEPRRLQTSRWAALARTAVVNTHGQVLWFRDAPIRAVFHADCGGRLSSAVDVWGGTAIPYLVAARDGGPAASAHVSWTLAVKPAALRDALNADPRTAVGTRLDGLRIVERDAAGRAERVEIKGTRTLVVRGEAFRTAVSRAFGAKSLRSTLFTVTRTRDGFRFAGRGFGHGVGLCQAGAFARLRAGRTPAQVLSFYYPGTSIADIANP